MQISGIHFTGITLGAAHALLYRHPDAVDADPERVHRDTERGGERAAPLDVSRFGVVRQEQRSRARRQTRQAGVQTRQRPLELLAGVIVECIGRMGYLPSGIDDVEPTALTPVLAHDVLSDAVEVRVEIGGADLDTLGEAPRHTVDGAIDVFVRAGTAAPSKQLEQAAPKFLVALRRPLPIGIEQAKQSLETLAIERPSVVRRRSSGGRAQRNVRHKAACGNRPEGYVGSAPLRSP